MWIKLTRKEGYENFVRGFRKQICARLGIDPSAVDEDSDVVLLFVEPTPN